VEEGFMISRAQMRKQVSGDAMPVRKTKGRSSPKKMAGGGFVASGDDMRDLDAIRSSSRVDDGPSKMKKGGSVKKSRVNEAGNYTQPEKRKRIFNQIKAGGKGGAPGQWSARKAQMLAQRYKKAGGGYKD
jgi:hypothetical protein